MSRIAVFIKSEVGKAIPAQVDDETVHGIVERAGSTSACRASPSPRPTSRLEATFDSLLDCIR